MEQQLNDSKEFLDDLTIRDQQMMLALTTIVHTADSKKQLHAYTETQKTKILTRQLLNGNSFILGVSGAGKSFTA